MNDLPARISSVTGEPPTGLHELDGGEIDAVHRADFASRASLVAKTSDAPLTIEATMLRYLADHGLPVPDVYHVEDDLLLLEYIDGDSTITTDVERDMATHLAALHDTSASAYGFDCDTLTGSLPQPNPWTDSWVEFYGEYRLRHAAEVAHEIGELPDSMVERVETLVVNLDSLLVEPDSPSLIHGDVWTTNVLEAGGELRAFLDPATYYAHSEIELAYMDWTNCVGPAFFERYDELHGIDAGYESRRDVYGIYPLLSHVFHFGERYLSELDRTLRRVGY